MNTPCGGLASTAGPNGPARRTVKTGDAMSRAKRRHDDAVQKLRAKRFVKTFGWLDDERCVGRRAGTRCVCSKACCGNPRRHFGEVTRQEAVAEQ